MDPKENRNHQKRLIIVTLILFITSLIYVKLDSLIEILLRKEIFINDEHNEYTRSWMNPPVPINFDIYVFSIANPGNVFKKSKPKLKEYGPFSYDMKIEKEILSFSADQKIVKFYDIQSYYFKYGQSKGQLFQQVYVINFPAFAMASMVHSFVSSLPFANGLYPVVFGMLNAFFGSHRETAIKKLTVGQLLHGYRFEILDTMDKIAKPLALFGISLPDTGLADNKFGILWSKNLTRNGPYQVFTGRDDTNVLEMNAYKGKQSVFELIDKFESFLFRISFKLFYNRNLEFYDESSCNALNGTEGSALGLNVERHDYYIFQDDLCRSMKLTYVKDNWVNGIKTYRFIIDKKTFSSPEKNYENRCFCTDPSDEDFCDGVLNLFPCLKAPFGLSFPHLLYAGSKHKNSVLNLNPIVEKHLTFVEIEPN
ncbi:CD36-like protein 1 [Sarcoptes scabiei]|uniref:CD36-like protein 1 n=1 Tax=Sarcoptes scabiei TaxID=52283 RepID=A0A131ZUV8_SARSC|nr:CD36-like protein 1 [Sarcoptes scabiei]